MAFSRESSDPGVEILDLVLRYVRDETGLRELYQWIVEHVDWLTDAPASDGSDLARLIESHLAEMSVFRSDEDALRADVETYLSVRPELRDRT